MEKDDNIVLLESPLGGNSVLEDEFEGKTQEDVVEIKEEDVVDLLECRKRKYSSAWDHFDIVREPSGEVVGVCKYCRNGKYTTKGRSGTTNLHRHLGRCTEYQKHLSKTESSSKTVDQLEYRRLLAQAILQHGYSFSWVEHEGNRKLHTRLNGDVQPICRNTAKKDCLSLHNEMKANLKELMGLPGRICCTSDLWTSINTKGYMCLTAQYIDENWKIQSKVLCFRHCPPPHGRFELAQEMRDALLEWGIEKKIFSLTLDNATNNDKMITILKQGVFKDAICEGKYVRIRCSAHILNLVVKDGLLLIKPLVSKVRDGVRYIVGSEGRMQKFAECVKRYDVPISTKLSLDVPTRWNSTYIMLDKAFKYRDAINYYFAGVDGGPDYILNPIEWARVDKICSLLEPFNAVTEMFSGSEYPTANLFFPQVWKIRNRLQNIVACDDIDISAAAVDMLEKFDKYWSDYVPILKFAIILDSRFKLRFVLFASSKQHGSVEGKRMTKEVELQFDELYIAYGGAATNMRNDNSSQNESLDGLEEFATLDQVSTSEVDIYLSEGTLPVTTKLDVLNYWKENSFRFPILSSMARDVLAIPITSVASESSFSMGGRILNKWRSSLLPNNVEALVTTQNWLNGYSAEGESLEDE